MDFFRDLGFAVLDRWRKVDFDGCAFPDIAAAALRESSPSTHVDPLDVVRWVHTAPALVSQADIDSKFGQPPITVFWCERFYIDVLFWVDGTTSIHQHGFSGAFHLLEGSSIQSTYRFAPARRYCEQLSLGKLEFVDCELLGKGDVRPIRAGSEFIHAVFHLDRPSVSVVVRTPVDEGACPQYGYTRGGFAFDPFARIESMKRRIQTLDLLYELGHRDFEPLARTAIRDADSFLAFSLLTHLMKRIEPNDRYLSFLETVRTAHGELIDALKDDAIAGWRETRIIRLRQRAKQSEHRFFLALLLNVPDRCRILDLVRVAFPHEQPATTIVRWLTELEKIDEIQAWVAEASKAANRDDSRILDVQLDSASAEILKYLLDGVPEDSLPERLNMSSAEGDIRSTDVATKCAALRRSRLLRPLLIP